MRDRWMRDGWMRDESDVRGRLDNVARGGRR